MASFEDPSLGKLGLTMLFVCRLVCYQKLVWLKTKKKKESDFVFCFACTLLFLASV